MGRRARSSRGADDAEDADGSAEAAQRDDLIDATKAARPTPQGTRRQRSPVGWQEHGLQPPSIVTEATTVYERDSDPLGVFLAEACELAPNTEVGAREIFLHYESWAVAHGLRPGERLSSTAFGRKMAERFERIDGAPRTYRGVARRQAR